MSQLDKLALKAISDAIRDLSRKTTEYKSTDLAIDGTLATAVTFLKQYVVSGANPICVKTTLQLGRSGSPPRDCPKAVIRIGSAESKAKTKSIKTEAYLDTGDNVCPSVSLQV